MDTPTVQFTSKEALNYDESFWDVEKHYITRFKTVPADMDGMYNIQVTVEEPDGERTATLETTEPLNSEWAEWVESAIEYNKRQSGGVTLENQDGVATFEDEFYPA